MKAHNQIVGLCSNTVSRPDGTPVTMLMKVEAVGSCSGALDFSSGVACRSTWTWNDDQKPMTKMLKSEHPSWSSQTFVLSG